MEKKEEIIKIKPHHFFDIIKLYGSGLDKFIPDEKMDHDFYRIGTIILNNKDVMLSLTLDADDICTPCKYCQNNMCSDKLESIPGYDKKDAYNKELDKRIIEFYNLDINKKYSAIELCRTYLSEPEFINKVWQEENEEKVKRRNQLFLSGVKRYVLKKKEII